MITNWLISLGVWGDGDHAQRLDNLQFEDRPNTIVFRRSVPHASRWTDVFPAIVEKIRAAGYDIYFVYIVRADYYTARSQVRRKHTDSIKKAEGRIKRAHQEIKEFLKDKTFLYTTYETFVEDSVWRDNVQRQLELDGESDMKFYNANKHYDTLDSKGVAY